MTYRDDKEAQAYKRIADLEEENRKLRSAVPRRVWNFAGVFEAFSIEKASLWTLYFLVSAFASLLFYCAYKGVTRTDAIEHCYTDWVTYNNGNTVYYLKGYREWDSDVTLSRHDSLVNVLKAAEMLKCPLLKR